MQNTFNDKRASYKPVGSADQFHYGDLRYDYHQTRKEFVRKDSKDSWVYTDSAIPKPGDYLTRIGQEDLMVVHWDSVNKTVWAIQGPYPVALRIINIDAEEAAGKPYAL